MQSKDTVTQLFHGARTAKVLCEDCAMSATFLSSLCVVQARALIKFLLVLVIIILAMFLSVHALF